MKLTTKIRLVSLIFPSIGRSFARLKRERDEALKRAHISLNKEKVEKRKFEALTQAVSINGHRK